MYILKPFIKSLLFCVLTNLTVYTVQCFQENIKITSNMPSSASKKIHLLESSNLHQLNRLKRHLKGQEVIPKDLSRLRFGTWVKQKTILPSTSRSNLHEWRFLPFPRIARARLARMPLAFGKRTNGHVWDREKRQSIDRFTRARVDRMPLTFGKRVSEGIDKNVSGDSDDTYYISDIPNANNFPYSSKISKEFENRFIRQQKSRLRRMPITFGKRVVSAIEGINLENELRGFGEHKGFAIDNDKEADQYSQRQMIFRERRGRMSRMPLTFGRRGRTKFQNIYEDVVAPSAAHHIPLTTNVSSRLLLRLINAVPSRESEQSGESLILGNDDPTNDTGTSQRSDESQDFTKDSDMDAGFQLEQRSALHRMPISFGKRSSKEHVSDGAGWVDVM